MVRNTAAISLSLLSPILLPIVLAHILHALCKVDIRHRRVEAFTRHVPQLAVEAEGSVALVVVAGAAEVTKVTLKTEIHRVPAEAGLLHPDDHVVLPARLGSGTGGGGSSKA